MINSRVSLKNVPGTSRTRKSLSTSARASPFLTRSAAWNSSRNQSLLNSSLQSSLTIEDTGSHVVEGFGTPLPVLVNEALTLAERGRDVSARLDSSGWAWLVCGRRLFVWKYKLNPGQRLSSAPQCRELTLPPSDLAHKADLVCVFPSDDRHVPSALAVSPEGTICYWPSIAHERSSVEANAELHGQECYSLTTCQPYGCVLATTTSTLILISPTGGSGQENSLVCRNLTVAKGVLARFSRRVSSFIFGPIPSQTTESRLVRVLVSSELDSDLKILYILSGNTLQKWEIGEGERDQLMFDCDVETLMREKFVERFWSSETIYPHQLRMWLIDMQLNRHGLFILTSAVSPREPQRVYYALGVFEVSGMVPPSSVSAFFVISHNDTFQDAEEEDFMLSYRLLLPDSKSDCAFVYKHNIVLCIPLTASSDEADKVEFRQPGDHILGAGSFDGLPLFFSQKHGIVSVSVSSPDDSLSVANTSGMIDTPSESYSLTCSAAQLEDLTASDDKTSQLKAALLLFCQKNVLQSRAIITESFPSSLTTGTEINSVLDTAVIALSKQTIDDFPVIDPRWAETIPRECGITSSMIILHQLEDKHKAHQLFLNFLQQTDLWERLQLVTVAGHNVSSRRILYEHAEKLVAAKALRGLHAQYANLIESAIKISLNSRKVAPTGKLTNQDMFYREVSCIQDIIPALLEAEEAHIADGVTQLLVTTVSAVNNILLTILRQVFQYQQLHVSRSSSDVFQVEGEYIPWTSTTDSSVMRTWLFKQNTIILDHAVKAAQDTVLRGALFQQLMDIIDIILDGYRNQLQSLEHTNTEPGHYETLLRKYEQDRLSLILPLLNAEQHERAASLAEKYLDFEILVRLCEATDNHERLNRYIIQFADQGFLEFTFKWFLKEGKRGKLLSHPVLQQDSLQHFLKEHRNLSWLQDINLGRYTQAHQTLRALGLEETDMLARKKTLLSYSKLCALASDGSAEEIDREVQEINQEHDLILYQETLPARVLEGYGYDLDTMRVLSPTELIEMYVCEDNASANEYDFKKALDLLQFVRKDAPHEFEQLNYHIWCRAILKDDWSGMDQGVDDPIETCSQTVFFRTVETAFNAGCDLQDILPNMNKLLECEELGSLKDNATFQYLIHAGYEQIVRVMS